jgi:transcription antitermination factor NusG
MGIEEEAVFYLLQQAEAEHQLRSAFTRGSIRGWIYLEANMNGNLLQLLRLTPGVISSRQGVLRYIIDPSDWLKMLTMHDPRTIFQVGNWVRVGKGRYKGDVGFVARVESFIEVLLVPHLNPPTTVDALKRKRTVVRSKPQIVDRDTIKKVYAVDPRHGPEEEAFTAIGLKFHHGLLQKAYDFHSVAPATVIPSSFFTLFLLSDHPLVLSSEFPKPQEWIFEEGDSVIICSASEQATVTAIEPGHLEVCLSNGSGNMAVPWCDVRKAIRVGDFVEVTSSSLMGVAGWVNRVDEEVVNIVEKVAGATSPDTVKVYFGEPDLFIFANSVDRDLKFTLIG